MNLNAEDTEEIGGGGSTTDGDLSVGLAATGTGGADGADNSDGSVQGISRVMLSSNKDAGLSNIQNMLK